MVQIYHLILDDMTIKLTYTIENKINIAIIGIIHNKKNSFYDWMILIYRLNMLFNMTYKYNRMSNRCYKRKV